MPKDSVELEFVQNFVEYVGQHHFIQDYTMENAATKIFQCDFFTPRYESELF
jgi:hypothetical protein